MKRDPFTLTNFALLVVVVLFGALVFSFFGSRVNNTFSRIGYGLGDGTISTSDRVPGRLTESDETPKSPADTWSVGFGSSGGSSASSGPAVPAAGEAPAPPVDVAGSDLDRSGHIAAYPTPAPATAGEAPELALRGIGPATGSGSSGSHLNTGTTAPPAYQSPLTAGQVDDNARFPEYLDYINTYYGPSVDRINVAQRMFVQVLDNDQHPIAGAKVELFDGLRKIFEGRTVSNGRVLFFPEEAGAIQAQQLHAVIERGQQRIEADLKAGVLDQQVVLPVPDNTGPVNLDIVWLVDATGSMGDEIDTIKATIGTIASRIGQLSGSGQLNLGLVAYRDQGDEYVTRSWGFGDVQTFSANLSQVYANGGGDQPEAVNAGLHEAINLPGWSDTSSGRHLRMVILVGDAPPQLNYPNDHEYPQLLKEATARGIKIFPIGASGLEQQGEYIFRQFAQVTQGQFVFLTYANGVSGAPGPSTDKHVENFTVNNLDSLVVRLVAGEIANQTGEKIEGINPVPAPMQTSAIVPTVPAATSTDLLGSLGALVARWGGQMVVISSAFWLVVLISLLYVGRRLPQRARVMALPAGSLEPAPEDFDLVEDRDPAPDYEYDYVPAQQTPYGAATALPPGWLLATNDAGEAYQSAPPSEQLTVPLSDLPPEVAHALRR